MVMQAPTGSQMVQLDLIGLGTINFSQFKVMVVASLVCKAV